MKCHQTWPVTFILSGDILQASDDLTHAINSYKKIEKELTVIAEIQSAHQQGRFKQWTLQHVSDTGDILLQYKIIEKKINQKFNFQLHFLS